MIRSRLTSLLVALSLAHLIPSSVLGASALPPLQPLGRTNKPTFAAVRVSSGVYPTGSMTFFGDSFTVGATYCPTVSTGEDYPSLVAAATGITKTNLAVGGKTITDSSITDQIYASNTGTSLLSSINVGQNDYRKNNFHVAGNNTNKLTQWGDVYAALMAWRSLAPAAKLKVQSASVTKAGTWSNDSHYASGLGMKTSTPTDYLQASLVGTSVYVAYTRAVGTTANFTVTIDGAAQVDQSDGDTTFTTAPPGGAISYSSESRTYETSLLRFNGLSNTAHTVIVALSSVTGGTFDVQWLGSNSAAANTAAGPMVLPATASRMKTLAAYEAASATHTLAEWDAIVGTYNDKVKSVAGSLAADGLMVRPWDAGGAYDPATQSCAAEGSDPVHPDETGQTALANALIKSMNLVQASSSSVASAGGGITDPLTPGGIVYAPTPSTLASTTTPSASSFTGTATYDAVVAAATPFTGNTNKSLFRLGAAPYGASSNGLYESINAPVGYLGNFALWQVGNVDKFRFTGAGNLHIGNVGTQTGTSQVSLYDATANGATSVRDITSGLYIANGANSGSGTALIKTGVWGANSGPTFADGGYWKSIGRLDNFVDQEFGSYLNNGAETPFIRLYNSSTPKIGLLGSLYPTNDLGLKGTSAKVFGVEQDTITNGQGFGLTVTGGSPALNMVSTAAISGGGTGYTVGDVLSVASTTNGASATFTVSSVSGGVVTGITVTSKGSKMVTGIQATTGGTGTGATIDITALENATNRNGGGLILQGSPGSTGTGTDTVTIQTSTPGSTGTAINTVTPRAVFDYNGQALTGTLTASGSVVLGTNGTSLIKALDSTGSTVNLLRLTTGPNDITRLIAGNDTGGIQVTNQAQNASWMNITSTGTTVNGSLTTKRLLSGNATAHVSGDWVASAGWGTGPTVSVTGNDSRGIVTVITSATADQAANPTLTLTFKDGTWTTAPFPQVTWEGSSTGVTTAAPKASSTATTMTIYYDGTPAPSKVYKWYYSVRN